METGDACSSLPIPVLPSNGGGKFPVTAAVKRVVGDPGSSEFAAPMEWTDASSGLQPNDELWVVHMHSDGRKSEIFTIGKSDMNYLRLNCLLVQAGYNVEDCMYYVKHGGRGKGGLELIDSDDKVKQMVKKYEVLRVVNLTILTNAAQFYSHVPAIMKNKNVRKRTIIHHVATTQEIVQIGRRDQPMFDDVLITQETLVLDKRGEADKGKGIVNEPEVVPCQDKGDLENLSEGELDEEELQNLAEYKRQKDDPLEGDTDVEELFPMEIGKKTIAQEEIHELSTVGSSNPPKKKMKVAKKRRPQIMTEGNTNMEPMHFSDPGSDDLGGDLISSDDDGFETPICVAPKTKKSRAKPLAPRVWYDEDRLLGGEQWVLKMCFVDIYQFRRALKNYHIRESRDYMYQLAYNTMIYPVPDKLGWTKTETVDIDPPIFTRHPGRPKKNRRKGVHEVPQPSGNNRMTTTTCSN